MPNQSEPAELDLGLIFKALSDPTRRTVVQRLAQRPATASALAKPFDMALPSFLQHMDLLEKCGLVSSEKTGRSRTYSLSPKQLRAAEDWMSAQRESWEKRLNQLDSYLDRLHRSRQTNPNKEKQP